MPSKDPEKRRAQHRLYNATKRDYAAEYARQLPRSEEELEKRRVAGRAYRARKRAELRAARFSAQELGSGPLAGEGSADRT